MNQTLIKLLQLQQQRMKLIYLAKRQLHIPQLYNTIQKYSILDSQIAVQEQQLVESLNLIKELKQYEQGLFKRWTIKILILLEIPHYLLGKMESTSNILDSYAELWRFWSEFGLAMKMEWMKIRIKTHQVSVYRMLAQKLIHHVRKKLLNKIKSYKIFIRTTKPSLEQVPFIMTGSKIGHESPSPVVEKTNLKPNNRSSIIKSALPLKNRSILSHSDHLLKSVNFQKNKQQQKKQTIVQIKNKKIYDRVLTSYGSFSKKRIPLNIKKKVLKTIYEPIDIKIQQSYPLKLNKQQILKSLMTRNNVAISQGPIFKKQVKFQQRVHTLSDCVGKNYRKVDVIKKINEDAFLHNRISL